MNERNKTFNNTETEITSITNRETDDFNLVSIGINEQISDRAPLLPRSAWQDRKAFLSLLIKTKCSLDLAEITVLFN